MKMQPIYVGIALAIAATACFGVFDTTTKYVVTHGTSLTLALWVRYTFQSLTTTAVILPQQGLAIFRTRALHLQILRGLLLVSISLFSMYTLTFMPVGEFTAIMMMAPLLITLFAVLVLKESVSLVRWLLLAGGFAGTLLIIRPGAGDFQWMVALPLSLVVANAWFQVITSRLARLDAPATTHLYTGLVGAVVASILLPFTWQASPHWTTWLLLIFMGLCSSGGHFLLILAYGRAAAAAITPYLYGQILFAMAGGWLVFDPAPDQWALAGMALVGLCGATTAWVVTRENRVMGAASPKG
ncbi:MAG: Riboflavin transporter [Paracidovorax wautersii]|uniref:Riboflavin transporter n=1 Tax=Paracidovorax wautersii TaxID=1177982 RepID=A0A7V8JS88_9BURK|nr:MAG: Riboflavin transporter [Paracidovorax wautersii]